MLASHRKRTREEDDDNAANKQDAHFDKRTRQINGRPGDDEKWYHGHHDSVISTPILLRDQTKYDRDDEQSSVVSESGSPQDVSMSSGDEGDATTFSESPEDNFPTQPRASRSAWGPRLQTHRVATPTVSMMRPSPKISVKQHIRRRHPQENISSDHLEVPSPIDEDDVPTPPSAAEAAGSQLSLLSVSDIDMDGNDLVPTISIDPARPANHNPLSNIISRIEGDAMDSSGPTNLTVRKQRQRSGALSSGNSPVRAGPSNPAPAKQRGFSVGFRADCEKCRMRIPGHMNHYLG